MAQLTSTSTSLLVTLSAAEKVEAMRGDIEVPLSSVGEIEVLNDAIHEIHGLMPSGFKIVGTYLPGRLAMGTLFAGPHAKKTFAAVHHGTTGGLRIRLEDADFGALIIGCDQPEILQLELQRDLRRDQLRDTGPDAARPEQERPDH